MIYKITWAFIFYFQDFFKHGFSAQLQIVDLIKNHFYEKKLGIETTGLYYYRDRASAYRDAENYQATKYQLLEKIFCRLQLRPDDIFIDLGCGKGRVIFFVAREKIKKIIGVELDKKLVALARQNLGRLKINHPPIEIVQTDAGRYRFRDETIIFLYHPFGQKTLRKVLDNIKKSLISQPRKIKIIYNNAVYKRILDNEDWLVGGRQIKKTPVQVWQNRRWTR